MLRSTFERSTSTGSRSDLRRGRSSNSTNISPGGSSIAIGEDVVDQSLPSMADALDKFRRLERSRRPGRETGGTGRSSSAEAYERVRFSEEPQVFGSNRRSLEFEDSEKQDTTPQISNLVALFSHMEGKKSSRGSANKRALEQQKSFGKSIVQQKDREPSQIGKGSEEDEETELPEEGTVQALLLQWKALETPLRKKRRSWMETQASRQADQSKDRRSWTPVASQKTMVSVQKSPSVSQKTPVAFQNTGVTSKKPSIAAQNTTWASQYSKLTSLKTQVAPNNTHAASYNTQVAPQKTQVASNYNHVASQKTQVAPHKTQVAPQKTQVISNKPYNRDDGDKIRATSTKDSWTTNGSLGHGKADDLHERTGKDKDQDDDQVSFDGIAKNMTEKFRELERKNAYNDEFDGSLKRKVCGETSSSPSHTKRLISLQEISINKEGHQ